MQNDQIMENQTNNNGLYVGQFIKAIYGYSFAYGTITKINKNTVTIETYTQSGNEYTKKNEVVKATKNRIFQIGLKENESIKN